MKRLLLFFAVIVAFSFQLPGTCIYIFTTGIPCTNQQAEGSQYCSQHKVPAPKPCAFSFIGPNGGVIHCQYNAMPGANVCAGHIGSVPPLQ